MRKVNWLPYLFATVSFLIVPMANAVCEPTLGPITSTLVGAGCTSPVGICTTGTISAGPLTGTTFFSATSLEVRGQVLFFCGVFTVFTATGVASYDTCGTLNQTTGKFEETFTLTSGAGSFTDATSRLVSTGSSTPTGFEGNFEGVVCSN